MISGAHEFNLRRCFEISEYSVDDIIDFQELRELGIGNGAVKESQEEQNDGSWLPMSPFETTTSFEALKPEKQNRLVFVPKSATMAVFCSSWDTCTPAKCFPYLFLGAIILALLEFLLLLYIVGKAWRSRTRRGKASEVSIDTQGDSISFSLQGNLWVAPLVCGDWSKATSKQVGNDMMPSLRHANLGDRVLHLKARDGTEETISLNGCRVFAVSGGVGPKQKWDKKYPIQVYHTDRTIYRGSKTCLFYLETSWEKEAWCEVLRATAQLGSATNDGYLKTKKEYALYTHNVEKFMPYVTEFHTNKGANHFDIGQQDKKSDGNKSNDGTSRKRLIWNVVTRRGSKAKANSNPKGVKLTDASSKQDHSREQLTPAPHREEDRNSKGKVAGNTRRVDTNTSHQSGVRSNLTSARSLDSGTEIPEKDARASVDSTGEDPVVAATNASNDEKATDIIVTEGTEGELRVDPGMTIEPGLVCFNMVIARLYFDFYHSPERVASIQHRLQRQLSKMRTPSYVKSVTITKLDLGKSPPFATAVHMLPADEGGTLAVEMDMVWNSGGCVTIETRIDMQDLNTREKMAAEAQEPGLAGAAATALLTGLEKDSDITNTGMSAEFPQRTASEGPSARRGRWLHSVKSWMSHVADQVAQVPLVLRIECVLIKGTGLMRLRAPPTDRIWFAYKEMPELKLVPKLAIGDHPINSGALGALIVHELQEQWRESLVLPNYQSISVRWMMGDDDDWLPKSAFPVAFAPTQAFDVDEHNLKNNETEKKTQKHSPARTPSHTTNLRPSSDTNQLARSLGSHTLQPDMIDEEEVANGGFPVLSPSESDIGGSDKSVEVAAQEVNSSFSDSDVHHLADHTHENSSDQQSKHSKVAFVGKMAMRLEERRHKVVDKLREQKHP